MATTKAMTVMINEQQQLRRIVGRSARRMLKNKLAAAGWPRSKVNALVRLDTSTRRGVIRIRALYYILYLSEGNSRGMKGKAFLPSYYNSIDKMVGRVGAQYATRGVSEAIRELLKA